MVPICTSTGARGDEHVAGDASAGDPNADNCGEASVAWASSQAGAAAAPQKDVMPVCPEEEMDNASTAVSTMSSSSVGGHAGRSGLTECSWQVQGTQAVAWQGMGAWQGWADGNGWADGDGWQHIAGWMPNGTNAMGWGKSSAAEGWCAAGGNDGATGDGWWAAVPWQESDHGSEAFHNYNRGSSASLASEDQHTASVHLHKTYQVLSEILEAHPAAFEEVGSFLDLGCAPGGFASRLLEERPSARGFGLTLPYEAGGFPMLFEDQRLQVRSCDLMAVTGPEELDTVGEVDVCMADAQDLGRRTNPLNNQRGAAKRGKAAKAAAAKEARDRESAGVQAALSVLGIWALTFQELLLGLSHLRAGGSLVFRFGWRGRGASEESWYREATNRLFALVFAHFAVVSAFKSEFSHQADPCFYTVASGFRRDDYEAAGLAARLKEAIEHIVACWRVADLPWCIETLDVFLTPEMRVRIDDMLDGVGRLRAIGLASRHRVEANKHSNPEGAIWISPVPFSLTMQRLRERLEKFGKIVHVKRRAHPIGVGADALVQFAQPAHATNVLEAVNDMGILGANVTAKRLSEVQGKSS